MWWLIIGDMVTSLRYGGTLERFRGQLLKMWWLVVKICADQLVIQWLIGEMWWLVKRYDGSLLEMWWLVIKRYGGSLLEMQFFVKRYDVSLLEMWWLVVTVKDMMAHYWRCGGALLLRDMVAHYWRCGGQLLRDMMAHYWNVVASCYCKRYDGSLLEM